jgi:uncharacterized protein DUF1707
MGMQTPVRLASEDVIINAPLSYVGSAQRIMRMRRLADDGSRLVAITLLAVLLVLVAWTFVTAWYLFWGLLLVPYRVLRRGARKRTAEALRHRELMGTIQGSAVASANAIVASQISASSKSPTIYSPTELVADTDRDHAIDELRHHMLAGTLTTPEFEERLASAHIARTRAELDSVRVDLPVRPEASGHAPA